MSSSAKRTTKPVQPKIRATVPTNIFLKPLTFDFKQLFLALAKGIGHGVVGKWEELGTDTVEALAAIGLETNPAELGFLLIKRSLFKATFSLLGESSSQLFPTVPIVSVNVPNLEEMLVTVEIDRTFLDRPASIPLISQYQNLLQHWLVLHGVDKSSATAVSNRLPSYFVYALNEEWRTQSKTYSPLLAALNTPFAKAGEREWAWSTYSALLQRRVSEGIFDEPFGLSQIFVSPYASFIEPKAFSERRGELDSAVRSGKKIVVDLERELTSWLAGDRLDDSIRVISGGPGSGKSSFARIFAANISRLGKTRVLFVPLHLVDPTRDLVDEVGRFVRDEQVLIQNPLDPDSPESDLLVIFDGLDELASQGKASAETARSFIREVERTVQRRNQQTARLRILISGREVAIQENELEFRRSRQVLTLLPYYVKGVRQEGVFHSGADGEFHDEEKLLDNDLRNKWWTTYGKLTGRPYKGLPTELRRNDLDEITSQPLLNYLVALSLSRDKLDFSKGIVLNAIYADLVAAVHERAYEKHRVYGPIRDMSLDEFSRALEEVGLAAWHGDGRTTTVREIEEHCQKSGIGKLLEKFKDGAEAGVTRLLAAFFFRKHGQRTGGEPTFVFTHKSFGEYLAACRISRAVDKLDRELERRSKDPDEGWGEQECLTHWGQIFGPSAISTYIHIFLINDLRLKPPLNILRYHKSLTELFSRVLNHGMPMGELKHLSFSEALFQARNSEESLLVCLNACARITGSPSTIECSDVAVFGKWFKRIQEQRTGSDSVLAASCLSLLNLELPCLDIGDFWGACLQGSILINANAHYAVFGYADLSRSDLSHLSASWIVFERANLQAANLSHAVLPDAKFKGANLRNANLQNAILERADLTDADLTDADLNGTRLNGAILTGAILKGTILESADLETIISPLPINEQSSPPKPHFSFMARTAMEL